MIAECRLQNAKLKKKFFLIGILLVLISALLLTPDYVSAAQGSLVPECAHNRGGCSTLDSLMQLVVNYGRFLLGISGSLALVFFVWGGIIMMTSGGNKARVEKGRDAIIRATVGLIIIFGAFTAVKFMLSILDPSGSYDLYVEGDAAKKAAADAAKEKK